VALGALVLWTPLGPGQELLEDPKVAELYLGGARR
jgi:hypothetical protein